MSGTPTYANGSWRPSVSLSCRYNLAQAYLAAGRLDEAIPLFERTLTDAERVLGGTHPTTQAFRNSLTQAYQAVIRRTDL